MGSLFGGGGGGSGQAPNPPKPLKINLGGMEQQMTAADREAYGQADLYNSIYYPQLTKARDSMISDAYKGLTGPTDPSLENSFVNNANMGSAAALGSGDQGFGLSKGSLARNAAAANVASNEQNYQDYNRGLFENLNATMAPRAFGMTPEDAANVFTFNNTQMNNYLQQKFAGQTQAFYQGQGQSAAAGASTVGTITSLIGAAAAAY